MSAEDQDVETSELGALKDLVQSEGWRLMKAHADKEWGPAGYGWQMQAALARIPNGPDRAYEVAAVAERVDATAKAVNNLFAYPQERIAQLTVTKATRPFDALRRIGR